MELSYFIILVLNGLTFAGLLFVVASGQTFVSHPGSRISCRKSHIYDTIFSGKRKTMCFIRTRSQYAISKKARDALLQIPLNHSIMNYSSGVFLFRRVTMALSITSRSI